tara:strand:- start:603 stop:794 length:192 start_codon:yes stop_codon:yes gene_type:complete
MGSIIVKIFQVLKILPFILYLTKKNVVRTISTDNKIENFEDEWGQFCEIDKKSLHNSNRDNSY